MMQPNKKPKRNWKPLRKYAVYSGLGFQMIVIIGGLTWLGSKIDEWQSTEQPYYTIVFALASIAISFYIVYKKATS